MCDPHKVPTPLIHNFGLIVYQMRNIEKPKNSSILKKNWCMNEKKVYKANICGGVKMAH